LPKGTILRREEKEGDENQGEADEVDGNLTTGLGGSGGAAQEGGRERGVTDEKNPN